MAGQEERCCLGHQEDCLAKHVWMLLSVCWRLCATSWKRWSNTAVPAPSLPVRIRCHGCARPYSGATAAGQRVQLIPGIGSVASRPTRVVVLGIGARSSTRVAKLCIRERARGRAVIPYVPHATAVSDVPCVGRRSNKEQKTRDTMSAVCCPGHDGVLVR
jgi:hypothetical protein